MSMDSFDDLFLQGCLSMLDEFMTGDMRRFLLVQDEIKDLSSELTMMMRLLRNGSAQGNVRNLIYEAEDVIDELSYEGAELQVFHQTASNMKDWYSAAQKYLTGFKLFGFRLMFKMGLWSLIRRIQILNRELITGQRLVRLASLKLESQRGASNDASVIMNPPDLDVCWKYEDDSIIFDTMEVISDSILSEEKSHVVVICGMAGIGKTTLASRLFRHHSVRGSFDCAAWAFVGSGFQTRHVYEDILMSLCYSRRDDMAVYSDLDLAEQLYDNLQGRRYLIVLDDVWTVDAWDCLNIAFPLSSAEPGSRVILTTRSVEVAQVTASYVHHMTGLNHDQSLALLFATAFRAQSPDSKDMQELTKIAMDIVGKCSGLPLAVKLMGGLLAAEKPTPWEWERIDQKLDSYQANSDGAVLEVLNLSYDSLPNYLKPCFLYLGIYPEGAEIETESLYRLWLAEGFYSPSKDPHGNASELDNAERYLYELSMRSLIQVHKKEVPNGWSYKSCYIPDLIRRLCLLKQVEGAFLLDMHLRRQHDIKTSPSSFPTSAYKIRRLSLSFDVGWVEHDKQHIRDCRQTSSAVEFWDLSRLRVFHARAFSKVKTELITWRSLGLMDLPEMLLDLSGLKSLRVLHCTGFNFSMTSLPAGIGKLHNLRYLSLRNCRINSLPSTICSLTFLETLDMRECTGSNKMILPNELQKLRSLEHLYLPWSFEVRGGGKLRLHELVKLEILVNFNSALCELKDLCKLQKLRKLVASVTGYIEDLAELSNCIKTSLKGLLFSSLQVTISAYNSAENRFTDKHVLEYLNLDVLHVQGSLEKLPLNMISEVLSELSLCGSELEEDPLEKLEKLANLLILTLRDNAFVGKHMTCSVSGMPRLRRLALLNLDNLESLVIRKGGMPNLFSLAIERCQSLNDPPEEFSFLMNLQEFKILHMPQEFMDRVSFVRQVSKKNKYASHQNKESSVCDRQLISV